MDTIESQAVEALEAQVSQVRVKLSALADDLQAADAELASLAPEREQYALLEQACSSLEKLGDLGVASLFWGERLPESIPSDHVRAVRTRVETFQQRVRDIDGRRQKISESMDREQDALELLDDDLYQAEQQEERRKLEWLIERDVGPAANRPQVLAWFRGGEDDRRFRKTLAAAMLAAVLLGALLPLIDLPLPAPNEIVEVPDRLAQLVQERAKVVPPPPPPVREERPEEKKQEPTPEPKPTQQRAEREQQLAGGPPPTPDQKPEPVGILAFREKFASLRQSTVQPKLGLQASISSDDNSVGRTERSMLTSNAPGSSGGINLASISRNVGGGGAGGGGNMQGVALTRASSGINAVSGPGGDRPLSSGPGLSRTDEEIQIVFDRYKSALYRLYNRELRKDPTLQGQMVLRITIEPDGSVSACALKASDMNAPELVVQIVDRVKTFNFGAKEVPTITIDYPIDFLPAA